MSHPVVSRSEWLESRKLLLEAEKEHTRRGDELAKQRQALPWVRIDKTYSFATDDGDASLDALFKGRSQLLVYHFMFGPDYKAGCPSCSAIADGFNGIFTHLAKHDVMLWAISSAPLAKLQAFKQRMKWNFPWASSFGNEFNGDFQVSSTEDEQRRGGIEYNYRRGGHAMLEAKLPPPVLEFAKSCGTDGLTYVRERPGLSAFVRENGVIYHTYSAYARGLDAVWNMYAWLDRAPKGRNESGLWWKRHDEYEAASSAGESCCKA